MNRRAFVKTLGAVLTVILAAVGGIGSAQDSAIRFQGQVEWVSGETMAVAPGSSRAINVDLSQVDQDQYDTLGPGDWVVVTGTVPAARDRVVATSVQRLAQ
jgi:type 1 fimbria pilin